MHLDLSYFHHGDLRGKPQVTRLCSSNGALLVCGWQTPSMACWTWLQHMEDEKLNPNIQGLHSHAIIPAQE